MSSTQWAPHMLKFDTSYVKKNFVWGVLCEGTVIFHTLQLLKFIICTYLIHLKLN
jgi:hypothetical protein